MKNEKNVILTTTQQTTSFVGQDPFQSNLNTFGQIILILVLFYKNVLVLWVSLVLEGTLLTMRECVQAKPTVCWSRDSVSISITPNVVQTLQGCWGLTHMLQGPLVFWPSFRHSLCWSLHKLHTNTHSGLTAPNNTGPAVSIATGRLNGRQWGWHGN